MEILFVASKLSDVNAFSSIIKKASLNPVIMDVRCFTLKNAHDNISISAGHETKFSNYGIWIRRKLFDDYSQ